VEFIQSFLAERWFVILVAIVVLFLAIKLAKAVIKWGLILAVLAALLWYGASYRGRVADAGRSAGTKMATQARDHAMHAIENEVDQARWEGKADGSFTVRTKSLKVEGKPGVKKVRVTFHGQSFEMDLEGAVAHLVEQAKKQSS